MLDHPTQNDSKRTIKPDKSYYAPGPAVSLPKGGGAIKGMGKKFDSNPVAGRGSMTFLIATSPGCTENINSKLSIQIEDQSPVKPFIPISIISNSGLMCEALVLLLRAHQNIHFIGGYTGAMEVSESIPNPSDHVVLIDSGIGSERTVSCIQQWRKFRPLPYIVVLELENDIDMILACIEAGANAYTLQGASSVEVNQVLLQLSQGTAQCSPEVTAKLFARLAALRTTQSLSVNNPLTRREIEVLQLIAKGYSDRAIALDLIIEICTVKHHVHNLLHKLAVRHRWDATRMAVDQGWIVLD